MEDLDSPELAPLSVPVGRVPHHGRLSEGVLPDTALMDEGQGGFDPWRHLTATSVTVALAVGVITGLLFALSDPLSFISPGGLAQGRVADPFAVVTSPALDFVERALGPVAFMTLASLVLAFTLGGHVRRAAVAGDEDALSSPERGAREHVYEAVHQADAAALERARFLAMVSHELRTPLNAIIGFSEIIRDESTGEGGLAAHAEFAEEIHASGRHLLSLVNQMLELATVEGDGTVPALEMVDVAATVEACRRHARGAIEAADLTLVVDLAADARQLWADPRMLQRIIDHLLSNAIKFTPPGGLITVRARHRERVLELAVVDTGVGIAENQIARVFEPFWQGAPIMSREHGGSGLGLALVKAMTDALGGTVRIGSRLSQGTAVTITLPLR